MSKPQCVFSKDLLLFCESSLQHTCTHWIPAQHNFRPAAGVTTCALLLLASLLLPAMAGELQLHAHIATPTTATPKDNHNNDLQQHQPDLAFSLTPHEPLAPLWVAQLFS
jgi:hypothetical protein